MTIDDIKDIDFGIMQHYDLRDDAIFYALNNTSLIVQELSKITNILSDLNIEFMVDENYNIKVSLD